MIKIRQSQLGKPMIAIMERLTIIKHAAKKSFRSLWLWWSLIKHVIESHSTIIPLAGQINEDMDQAPNTIIVHTNDHWN